MEHVLAKLIISDFMERCEWVLCITGDAELNKLQLELLLTDVRGEACKRISLEQRAIEIRLKFKKTSQQIIMKKF